MAFTLYALTMLYVGRGYSVPGDNQGEDGGQWGGQDHYQRRRPGNIYSAAVQ